MMLLLSKQTIFYVFKTPARFLILSFSLFFIGSIANEVKALEESPLFEYQADYDLKWRGLTLGSSQHTLKKIGAQYYQALAHSFPKMRFLPFFDSESSQFLIQNNTLIPLRYHCNKQENHKRQMGKLEFDWTNKKVKKQFFKKNNKHQDAGEMIEDLLPLAQDKMTHILQLRNDLKFTHKQSQIQRQRQFEYWVVESERNRKYIFTIVGQEKLKTPLGILETVILEHVSEDKKRTTKLWLATDLEYLMVKLIQIKNNKLIAEACVQKLKIKR